MTLSQADDFLAESEALNDCVAGFSDVDFGRATQFKGWTVDDVLVHLHFWNSIADLAATDEAAFAEQAPGLMTAAQSHGLRALENTAVTERGHALREAWIGRAREMAARWREFDPKMRMPWIGPSMSARSSMTARQMETWAHGFEVFDLVGRTRVETDRIRNIVVLGVNTFAWSHTVQGLAVPDAMPALVLTAPSGETWTYGDPVAGEIRGPAADFVAVVTQTRAFADTRLTATGDVARRWMERAQCFAGPPETPPSKGSRGLSA